MNNFAAAMLAVAALGFALRMITLISPAALPSLFPPDTKRAKRLRRAMRAVYTFLESVL